MTEKREIFTCRRCGHCCEGKGGIVLSARDLARLAAYIGQTEEEAARRYAEISNGKLKLRSGEDSYCVFFSKEAGCGIHAARPDICRAWPFFRGNLEDPFSLAMAREYCPGISRDAAFREFAKAGMAYLMDNGLLAEENITCANSLFFGQDNLRD